MDYLKPDYTAPTKTEAAAKAASIILKGSNLLKTTPKIGCPMPDETDRRELFMTFGAGAYVLRYMQQKTQ